MDDSFLCHCSLSLWADSTAKEMSTQAGLFATDLKNTLTRTVLVSISVKAKITTARPLSDLPTANESKSWIRQSVQTLKVWEKVSHDCEGARLRISVDASSFVPCICSQERNPQSKE